MADALSLIREPIEEDLRCYRELFVNTLQHDNPLLRVALNHLLQRQGKMMRPILVLLSARSCGTVNEAVLHAAVALELLHTASLVHDDVVDESDRRRGQKSVNALMDNKVAVLVGDFLLSKALYHAAATGSVRVVECVANLGQTLADGELKQLANIDSSVISEEAYYEVIRKKTASLFSACAEVGAFLAGGDDEHVQRMKMFGERVGVCFQLRDDIFDYDASHDVGKPSGNDMKEGKLTLPLIHSLLATGNSTMKDLAMKVRSGEATDADVEILLNFTHEQNGIDYAEEEMTRFSKEALEQLSSCSDEKILSSLRFYVNFVAQREI